MIYNTLRTGLIGIAGLLAMSTALAQSPTTLAPATLAPSIDSPQTRLRPIGAPSAVDQYRSSNQLADYRETVTRSNQDSQPQNGPATQQAVWMQNFDLPTIPGNAGGIRPDGFNAQPTSPPPTFVPPTTSPRSLPVNPIPNAAGSLAPVPMNPSSNRDYAPLIQPQLNNQFATMDNSCHVSGPSTYTAASASGCCAPVSYQAPPAYIAPPAPIAPPMAIAPQPVMVPGAPIIAAPRTGVPSGSLISFGQDRYPVQVGPGLFGQPVAYVPGQTCRNWIRYIFP